MPPPPKRLYPPFFFGNFFFAVKSPDAFWKARQDLLDTLASPAGHFTSDNLIAWERNLGFLGDPAFAAARHTHAKTEAEQGVAWRHATLVWAARQALRLDGDFVECGCYKGVSAAIIADTLDLTRPFYLYDLFEHDEGMDHHWMEEHGADLFDAVKARFAHRPNVVVTKGEVPGTLSNAPEKIAFLHVDMNEAGAEIAALDVLFERVVPGGMIVLDDFGWLAYRAQHVAETAWFKERGYSVLELPTGQGMVIR